MASAASPCSSPSSPAAPTLAQPSPTDADIVRRALGYPYARPSHSFLFRDGEAHALPRNFRPSTSLTPVLAIGSNAAPEQLCRKFGSNVTIPVLAVQVRGVDVVYSANISSYGSVPATLVESEARTTVSIFVTLLDEENLAIMHDTERRGYALCAIRPDSGVRFVWQDDDMGIADSDVLCYVGQRGPLLVDGEPVALAEIPASGRVFESMTQAQMMDRLAEDAGLELESREDFIVRNIRDAQRRAGIVERMDRDEGSDDCFDVISLLV